jgi:hypothetical protein
MALWLRSQSAIRCQPRSPGFDRSDYLWAIQGGRLVELFGLCSSSRCLLNQNGLDRSRSTSPRPAIEFSQWTRFLFPAVILETSVFQEGHGLGEPAPALEPPRNGDNAKNMGNVAVLENHPLRDQILEWQRLADQAKKRHEARHRSEPPHSGPQKLTPPSPPPRQE